MELIVGNFATKTLIFVGVNDSIQRAAEVMRDNKVSSAIVLDKNTARGIVTERDMTRKVVAVGLDPTKVTVGRIMSSPVITVTKSTDIITAARLMRDKNIKKLVVVDDNKVVGIFSERDILEIDPALHSKVLSGFGSKNKK